MAVSYDISTTSTTAEITFHGMYSDGYSQYKMLQIWLDNSFIEWTEELDFAWITDYTYTYTGLSPNTSYNFEVAVYTDEGGGWRERYSITGSFTTESGGGGGDNPYFDALIQGGTDIYVVVRNPPHDLRSVSYGIWSDSYNDSFDSSGGSHTFKNLPDGEYRVTASYIDDYGDVHILYSEDGYRAIFLTIGGGGGGENWRYTETSVIWDISSTTLAPYNLSQGIGQYFGITFARSGTAVIDVPSGANVDLFYTESDYGYDPSDGYPYTSSSRDKAESRHYHQFEVVSNTLYYVWIKGSTTSVDGGSNITISISDSGGNWSYSSATAVTAASGTTWKQISLSSRVGQYFQLNFLNSGTAIVEAPATANVHLFVTDGYYNYDPYDGFPYESSGGEKAESNYAFTLNVTSGSTYYVWVKGYDSSISGNYSIGISVSGGGGSWRYDRDDVQYEHTNVDTEFFEYVTLDRRVGSYFAVDFKYTNTVTFAFDGSYNAYLYVTAGINGYNPTTGEPSGAITGSGGTSLTTTVNAGTTYIVWVRGSTENVYGSVPVKVTPGQRWLVSAFSTTEISTQRIPVSFYLSAGYMYCIPVRFTQPCNARFYSTGGYNRVAWLTSSNNDIDRNTGTPNGTILASDTSGDGDYDFSYSVAATTYYFWVRSTSFNDTTQLSANFEPQISSSGKVWIYTSGGWKQATPWIYTANGWKQATPWIYTANGWKQTT